MSATSYMAKPIALITARGGSKGLPRKNILPMNGKPLIVWTIEAAQEACCIEDVYVSTEDTEIAAIAEKAGAHVILRPIELAQDDSSSDDVIEHAIIAIEATGKQVDQIALLQPTSPLRSARHIDECFELGKSLNARCMISVFKPRYTIAKAYMLGDDGTISSVLSPDTPHKRRQDVPEIFLPNGAIYLFHSADFKEKRSIPSSYVYPYVMPEELSIDIDNAIDFRCAESYLSRGIK